MPQHHDFTDDNVDAAIDFIIENGAQDRGQTISYSRVFDAAGLPPPQDLHFGGEYRFLANGDTVIATDATKEHLEQLVSSRNAGQRLITSKRCQPQTGAA